MKQRGKKFFKIILIIIALVIVSDIGYNKLVHTEYNSLNTMDKKMLEQLSQVYKTYSGNSKDIWKEGYNFNNVPLVLTPVSKDKGILHTYSYATCVYKLMNSIFSRKVELPKEMNLPPVYRVSFLSPYLANLWMPFNFEFRNVAKQHVAFFKYNPMNTEISNTDRAFKYFLMHEVFHEYRQVELWKNVNELHSSISEQKRYEEQYQLLLTEFAILDKAFNASNNEELIKILSDYVTVRDIRYNKFEYMKQEKEVETLEGCAEYIEFKYSNQVGDVLKPPFTVNGKNYKFSDVFKKEMLKGFIDNRTLSGFMDKDLYYFVGSSEGILLDKLEINWKDRVENKELIYDVLRDEVHKKISSTGKSLEDIKNEYGYNNFREQAQMIVDYFKVK